MCPIVKYSMISCIFFVTELFTILRIFVSLEYVRHFVIVMGGGRGGIAFAAIRFNP